MSSEKVKMKSAWNLTRLFLVAGMIASFGCNSHPETAEVIGCVTVNGNPITNRQIIFFPDRDKGNKGKTSIGKLNDKGEYFLSTYAPGDGAVVGWHKVIIKKPAGHENTLPILDKYADPTCPLLSAEVKAGEENQINFDLQL